MLDSRYYILFDNYEQCLTLHNLLDSGSIPNRIAPAPRGNGCKASCGVSLLIESQDIDRAKSCADKNDASYTDIFEISGQINPLRDKYC